MKTHFLTPDDLPTAVEILRNGGLVVFPTETVYGLGADALSETASARIFSAKGRPTDNPLIVHVSNSSELSAVVSAVPTLAHRLIDAFWPGPLTIVLPKRPEVPQSITAGLQTVAVRCPESKIARRLIELSGFPLAAPSANRSGRPSPTTFEMARAEMEGRVNAIIDGGECRHGLESTVVLVDEQSIRILRPGAVTRSMLSQVVEAESSAPGDDHGQGPAVSPGTRHRHYQPDARVYVTEKVDLDAISAEFRTERVGVLRVGPGLDDPPPTANPFIRVMAFADCAQYGRELYRSLYELDRAGSSVIVAELPGAGGLGDALRDRLLRAAGGEFFSVPDELGT